jgi:hypothetical protein
MPRSSLFSNIVTKAPKTNDVQITSVHDFLYPCASEGLPSPVNLADRLRPSRMTIHAMKPQTRLIVGFFFVAHQICLIDTRGNTTHGVSSRLMSNFCLPLPLSLSVVSARPASIRLGKAACILIIHLLLISLSSYRFSRDHPAPFHRRYL